MAEFVYTKLVEFIIPINNYPDKHDWEYIGGNSLYEIDQNCLRYKHDLEVKNAEEMDSNKPVRFIIHDAKGNPFIEYTGRKWGQIKDFIKDKLEDKNDERGTVVEGVES